MFFGAGRRAKAFDEKISSFLESRDQEIVPVVPLGANRLGENTILTTFVSDDFDQELAVMLTLLTEAEALYREATGRVHLTAGLLVAAAPLILGPPFVIGLSPSALSWAMIIGGAFLVCLNVVAAFSIVGAIESAKRFACRAYCLEEGICDRLTELLKDDDENPTGQHRLIQILKETSSKEDGKDPCASFRDFKKHPLKFLPSFGRNSLYLSAPWIGGFVALAYIGVGMAAQCNNAFLDRQIQQISIEPTVEVDIVDQESKSAWPGPAAGERNEAFATDESPNLEPATDEPKDEENSADELPVGGQ